MRLAKWRGHLLFAFRAVIFTDHYLSQSGVDYSRVLTAYFIKLLACKWGLYHYYKYQACIDETTRSLLGQSRDFQMNAKICICDSMGLTHRSTVTLQKCLIDYSLRMFIRPQGNFKWCIRSSLTSIVLYLLIALSFSLIKAHSKSCHGTRLLTLHLNHTLFLHVKWASISVKLSPNCGFSCAHLSIFE